MPGGGVVLDQETRCYECELSLPTPEADVHVEETADVYHATPDCERAESAERSVMQTTARAHAIPCVECFGIDD